MSAEAEIRRRISASGAMTFADFMALALYHPDGGYYTSGDRIGAAGDFYTSPTVHPAFGALFAVQLFQMWQLLGRPVPFTVVEAGAGSGLLCRDIVAGAQGLSSDFRQSLRYVCIDRRGTGGFERGLSGASRVASNGLSLRGVVGCVLSNELLDAMPVHQVTVEGGQLQEVYVALGGGVLVTQTGEPSTPLLEKRLESLGVKLAEGQVAEINLAVDGWVNDVAQSLDRGFVLTIDYGRWAADLYSPSERFRGTLTTFHNHLQTDRPLERIGRQDMTAQVDFTALARAGEGAGLDVLGYTNQSNFLQHLGLNYLLQHLPTGEGRRQAQRDRMGMRELAKPDGFGNFKVMALGKDVREPELWGFKPSEEAETLIESMPIPTLSPEHVDLSQGRYPSAETEFEVSWDSLWPTDGPES